MQLLRDDVHLFIKLSESLHFHYEEIIFRRPRAGSGYILAHLTVLLIIRSLADILLFPVVFTCAAN